MSRSKVGTVSCSHRRVSIAAASAACHPLSSSRDVCSRAARSASARSVCATVSSGRKTKADLRASFVSNDELMVR